MSFRDFGRRNSAPLQSYKQNNDGLSNSHHRHTMPKYNSGAARHNIGMTSTCASRHHHRAASLQLHPSYKEEQDYDSLDQNGNNCPQDDELQRLQVQRREEDYAIRVMQEREEEIRDIHRKMHVVNEIYKDLGEVVDQQQGQIDAIEDQFSHAAQNTERGLQQLEKANKKHNMPAVNSTEEQNNESEEQGTRQYFSFDSIRRGASLAAGEISARISAVGKMMTICSHGGASYVA